MNAKHKRYIPHLVALAIAFIMLIPTSGMLTAQAAAPSEYVLVDASHMNELRQMGAEIFTDYNNGFYLMKMPATSANSLSQVDFPVVRMSEHRYLDLYPSSYRFNPAKGIPEINGALRATDSNTYILQFVGPVKHEWVEKVRNAGAVIFSDVAKYGLIAKMSPDTANTVRNMPEIAWVGTYEPAYKITSKADINSENSGMFSLLVFKGYSPQSIADRLSLDGITVLSVQGRNVIISVQQNKLPAIASMEEVQNIGIYSQPKLMDLSADKVIHVREVWYPSYTGLSTRFIGKDQVVGIQDTGYDEGDDTAGPNDHFQGPLGDRVLRYKDQGGGSDPDGEKIGESHGSHCCGLISGNGWSWEKQYGYPTDDYEWDHAESVGAAPGANLSIDGIIDSNGNLKPSADYWDTEQNDGAQIYSNSWGGQPGDDYSSTYSTAVDDKSNSDNRRLFFFAAANAGPHRDTLNPDAQGKNGICVAASENFRPGEWFYDSNPNTITDFSSRGGNLSDTRIKPDLASPGGGEISLYARGQYDNDKGQGSYLINAVDQYNWSAKAPGSDGHQDYQYMQGTSMATPVAAGAAAVIRQYLTDTGYDSNASQSGQQIYSQIIKALMINGARRLPNTMYPGYDQGWGLINVKNSILPDPPVKLQYTEANMTSTGTWDAATNGSMALDVASARVPLKVTLTWIDTSGKDLNRDLHLYVEAPDGTWYHGNAYGTDGWTMPETTVNDSADTWIGDWDKGSGYDEVNNVEQVEVQYPATGTWKVEVIGYNVPSTTPFAVVVRADIGSLTPEYSLGMDVSGSSTIRVDQGGSATLPITITSYGTSSDTVDISDNIPTGLTTLYTYGGNSQSSYSLAAGKSATFILTVSADASTSPGVYPFSVSAMSSNDASVKAVRDLKVQVIDQNTKIPRMVQVTNASEDETSPAVTTFTDSNGQPWIFIAYVKSTPISPDAIYGGDTVMVTYSKLDSNGIPISWHEPIQLTNLNEYPQDVRILHGEGGSKGGNTSVYADRVWVIWTGDDPNATHTTLGSSTMSKGSWGRIAWADNSDYSSWTCPASGTNTTIDENSGSQTYNFKRVNSIQYRPYHNNSELVYIFEHLDYDSNGNIKAVHDGFCSSQDGGKTWSAAKDIDPGGDYFFFPNVMDGGNDYNDVVWMYVYHRASSGNDRDLSCQVYDDGGWGSDTGGATKDTDVLDNPHNLMFPVVAYDKSSGSNNRVFFAVLNDTSGAYRIDVGYYPNGAVSSSNPPPDTSDAWGTVKGSFGTSVSDDTYWKREIMNMISTPEDKGMWVQYMEKSTPLGLNIKAIYSTDQFGSVTYHNITSDSYAKGHQMSSSVNISGTDYVYTTYKMSIGEMEDVNYDIYVSIYHAGFESDPDTQAPEVLRIAATPTQYNSTDGTYMIDLAANPSFDVVATGDDGDKGRSGINSAYWLESDTSVKDPTTLDWSNAGSMDMNAHTAVEKVSTILTPAWWNNTIHRIWIKATDASGNSGYSYIDLRVIRAPIMGVSFGVGWNLVALPWFTSPTDINTALSGLSWTRAMVYKNGLWSTYNSNRPTRFNANFPMVDNTVGLWVYTTAAGELKKEMPSVNGNVTTISLHRGWNLVGYPSYTAKAVSDVMSGFDGTYDYIQAYDPSTGNIITLSGSANMRYDTGYWIHVTKAGTWTVNW